MTWIPSVCHHRFQWRTAQLVRLGGRPSRLFAISWCQSVLAFELHSTSLSMISSGPSSNYDNAGCSPFSALGGTIVCRDRRQYMDSQFTRRYVIYKVHGKQMAHRILHQAFRQGIERSIEKGVVGVGITKTLCGRSGIQLQRHLIHHDRIQRRHTQHGWSHGEVTISMRTPKDIFSFRHGFGRFNKKFRGFKLSCTRSTLLCSRNPKREILDGSAIILENG